MSQLKLTVMLIMDHTYIHTLDCSKCVYRWAADKLQDYQEKKTKSFSYLRHSLTFFLLWSCCFATVIFWTGNKGKSGHQNWLKIQVDK